MYLLILIPCIIMFLVRLHILNVWTVDHFYFGNQLVGNNISNWSLHSIIVIFVWKCGYVRSKSYIIKLVYHMDLTFCNQTATKSSIWYLVSFKITIYTRIKGRLNFKKLCNFQFLNNDFDAIIIFSHSLNAKIVKFTNDDYTNQCLLFYIVYLLLFWRSLHEEKCINTFYENSCNIFYLLKIYEYQLTN